MPKNLFKHLIVPQNLFECFYMSRTFFNVQIWTKIYVQIWPIIYKNQFEHLKLKIALNLFLMPEKQFQCENISMTRYIYLNI